MDLTVSAYAAFYVAAGVTSLVTGVFIWRRRHAPGGMWLFAMSISAAVWTYAEALDFSSVNLQSHILWSKVAYLGSTTAPVFFFLFTLAYTGQSRWTRPWVVAALLSPSVLVILAAWTNELHHLVWPSFQVLPGQPSIVIYGHGWGYWAITAYALSLGLLGSGRLLGIAFRTRNLYRAQSASVAIAALIPWVAEIIYSFSPAVVPGFDPSVTIVFTNAILAITLLHFKLLDVVPVSRDVLLEEMTDGLLVLDSDERVLEMNPAALRLLGVQGAVRAGVSLRDALAHWPEAVNCILDGKCHEGPQTLILSDGRHVSVHRLRLLEDGRDLQRDMYILRDITAQAHAERALQGAVKSLKMRMSEIEALQAELREQAIRDPLTGLHNRRFLAETLERELGRAAREGYSVSLIMFDIDHFKRVNDTLGHAAGDAELRSLGAELKAHIRVGDIACRYGGDEFLVVLPNTPLEVATQLAERWRLALREAMQRVGDARTGATLSLGVAAFPVHGTMSEEIIAAADSAVYASKAAGRNRVTPAYTAGETTGIWAGMRRSGAGAPATD